MLSKETWFVIVVPILALLVWAWLFDKTQLKKLLFVLDIFAANYLLLSIYKHFYVVGSAYMSDYQVTLASIFSSAKYYIFNNVDYFVIGAVGLAAGIAVWWGNRQDKTAAFCLAANLGGWAYLGGLCLWRMPVTYYVYPAIGFFAVSLAVLAHCRLKRYLFAALCALSCLTVYNNALVALSHIDLSNAYAEACHAIAENTGDKDRVVVENWQYFVEPIQHTNYWVSRLCGSCDVVGGYDSICGTIPDEQTLALWGTDAETC